MEQAEKQKQTGPKAQNSKKNSFFAKKSSPLKVASKNDPKEKEADSVLNSLEKNNSHLFSSGNSGRINRKIKDETKDENDDFDAPELVEDVLQESGSSLPDAAVHYVGRYFSYHWSDIKIHTDRKANIAAESINARAFTYKNHIVFNAGEFNMNTVEGKKILLHEIIHIIQNHSANNKIYRYTIEKNEDGTVKEAPAGELININVTDFDLPRDKGNVKDRYDAYVGQLFSVVDLSNANNKRTFHDTRRMDLLNKWKTKVSWDNIDTTRLDKDQKKLYYSVKASLDQKDISDGAETYKKWTNNIDHIIELQLAGSDGIDNLQILPGDPNQKSGRAINETIGKVTEEFKSTKPANYYKTSTRQLKVNIQSVAFTGTAFPEINGIEFPLETKLQALKGKSEIKKGKIQFKAGANPADAEVEDEKLKQDKFDELTPSTVNNSFARFIPLILIKDMGKKGKEFRSNFNHQMGTRKLPIEMKSNSELITLKADAENNLKFSPSEKKTNAISFYYPYLSPGKITSLKETNGEISGTAKIFPTVKFIKELDIHFSKDEFKIAKDIKITSPVKGLKVTESNISLNLFPDFQAQGSISFAVGNEKKPLMKGKIEAGVDTSGFFAKGDGEFFIPNVDEAKTKIEYKKTDNKYSLLASVNAKITSKNNKFLKGGNIEATYRDGKVEATGNIDLDIPRTKNTNIKVQYVNNNWIIKGKTTIAVPKINDVTLDILYDLSKNKLTGSGESGFTYKSFKGHIKIKYDDGKISGDGTLDVTKGKIKGNAKVKLSPNGNLSGEGNITVQLKKDIEGTAGIIFDENGKFTVKGKIKVLKPYTLFTGKKFEKILFSLTKSFPLPGVSAGPIGIQLEIKLVSMFKAGIGPAELRNIEVEAQFNPFEDDKNPSFKFSTTLNIAAFAELSASIQASIVLDALIANLKGGIRVTGIMRLNAGLNTKLTVEYANGVFVVNSDLSALLALLLLLNIEGVVEANVAGGYLGHWEKSWLLKQFSYAPPGLNVGVSLPIRYASNEPFRYPSINDFKIIEPKLDPESMTKDTIGKTGDEKKK